MLILMGLLTAVVTSTECEDQGFVLGPANEGKDEITHVAFPEDKDFVDRDPLKNIKVWVRSESWDIWVTRISISHQKASNSG